MSALAIALAANPLPPVVAAHSVDKQQQQPALVTPSLPPLPILSNSVPSSSSSSLVDAPVTDGTRRPNEHLAVLLSRELWKPDSLASQCDNFYCQVRFGLFERRHHCRKCGGIFCAACTSRATQLLDASKLDFLHPPRNIPISAFASPISPVINARVCDDCWDQLHGCPCTPHTPDLIRPSLTRALTHPISMLRFPLSQSGNSSLSSSIVETPPHSAIPLPLSKPRKARSLRTTPSLTSINTNASTRSSPTTPHTTRRMTLRQSPLSPTPDVERSYGELDAYPLRRCSVVCKATGGGRWEPKQEPMVNVSRPPITGDKAEHEIQLEREEEEERRRRANPVVSDGDFKYRFFREPEPEVLSSSFYALSTF